MRVRRLFSLIFLLILGNVQAEDVKTVTNYNLLVISDGEVDERTLDYVNHLNISVDCLNHCEFLTTQLDMPEKMSSQINLQHVVLPDASEKSKEILCDALNLNAHFVISIVRLNEVRRMIKLIATTGQIPTIQVHFSAWSYQRLDSADPTDNSSISQLTTDAKISNYITVVPPNTVYLNVMSDLVKKMNITKKVTLLYDDTYPSDSLWRQMLSRVPLEFTYMKMKTNETDIINQISELKIDNKVETLLLMGKTSNIEKFTLHAKEEIEKQRFKWIAFSKDVVSFICDECTSVNMFWIRPEDSFGDFNRMRLLKLRLDHAKEEEAEPIDNLSGENELEVSYYLDLVYIAWEFMKETNQSTEIYPVYGCFNGSLPSQNQFNGTIPLTELLDRELQGTYGYYMRDENKNSLYFLNLLTKFNKIWYELESKISKKMGNWTIVDGITEEYDSLDQDVRQIHTYRIGTVVQPPFVEKEIIEGKVVYTGYCIDLIGLIKENMKGTFKYVIYEVKDNMFGTMSDRGEWNGLVGDLIKGEADIALAPLSVMAERENYVDFTVPYYDLVGTTILMKKATDENSLFKFMMVLELPVWFCIVGAYVFTSLLLYLFDRFSPYSYTNNKEKYKDDPEKREFTFKECLWFCMTSLTPQGGGEAPKNISGRLVAATWWLFGFIIIASYTANLAAFLTVSRLDTPISSLEDLAKQYKIKYAPVKGSASETYFRRMAEIEEKFYDLWKDMSLNESISQQERAKLAVWDYPVSDKFTNMWRVMKESSLPETSEAAIARVLKSDHQGEGEGFAFIGDATEIRYAEMTNCQLQSIGNEFSRKPYAIAVQQGSPLKDAISNAILTLLNRRQLEHLKERWWHNNPKRIKCPRDTDQGDGISIKNIGGVFIVILAVKNRPSILGIALSIVTLIFEYYYYKQKAKKSKAANRQIVDGHEANANGLNNESIENRLSTSYRKPEYSNYGNNTFEIQE